MVVDLVNGPYHVYAVIPDRGVLPAEQVADSACRYLGGTFDWEFDGNFVKYWFSNSAARDAFEGYCALMCWQTL